MRVWLVQTGEELPIDGPNTRLLRTVNLADELSARGHDVVYFNSTFNHQQKVQRYEQSIMITSESSFDTQLLYGRAYKRNFSIQRINSHRDNAREFVEVTRGLAVPDVILCGYPPLELADECVQYAFERKIPIAVDCRDMWPEIIFDRIPRLLRPLTWPLNYFMTRQKKRIMSRATAITGITKAFVQWGLSAASRSQNILDIPFHLAVSPNIIDEAKVSAADQKWCDIIDDSDNTLIGCFAGALASRLDISALLDGIDLLNNLERQAIRIIFCGKGDLEQELARRAERNPAIVFGGWNNAAELNALMRRADFGILPYPNSSDFLASYPNKVGEYLVAGLPVMTPLEGVTGALLSEHNLKFGYLQGSSQSVASRLLLMINCRDHLTSLRPAAEALGRSHFDPNIIYPAFANWLEHLAVQKQSPRELTAA